MHPSHESHHAFLQPVSASESIAYHLWDSRMHPGIRPYAVDLGSVEASIARCQTLHGLTEFFALFVLQGLSEEKGTDRQGDHGLTVISTLGKE